VDTWLESTDKRACFPLGFSEIIRRHDLKSLRLHVVVRSLLDAYSLGSAYSCDLPTGSEQTMSSGTIGAQDWRAVACLSPSGERLLCVGESSSQVRAAYTGAWGEVIRDEDRPTVRAISLQKWAGQFWSGQWEHQQYLAVPTARVGKSTTGEASDIEAEAEADAEAEAEPEVDADDDAEIEDDEADDSATPGKTKKK
jgi:hypothetical protein